MANLEILIGYLRKHMDRYPLAALKAQLLKQNIPVTEIDAAISLVLAERPAPVAQPPAGAAMPTPLPASSPPTPAPRSFILCVDDEPGMREMLVQRLEMAGFRATSAGDAMQAVVQAEGMKVSLVIADIMMPGFGSGLDALKGFRSSPQLRKDVPVIFLTGMEPDKAWQLLPKDDPNVRLMTKPVDWKELERNIREMLGAAGTA